MTSGEPAVQPVASAGLADPPEPSRAEAIQASRRSVSRFGRLLAAVLQHDPLTVLAALILLVVVAAGLLAPVLFPRDPMGIVADPFIWPGTDASYPLGTDSLGRDILAELVHGARISLQVGLLATAAGLASGVTIGAVAGYFGGWVDALLSRLIELFQILPAFVTLVVMMAITKPSILMLSLSIAIVTWPTLARLTRSEFLSIREKDFIMAAHALGYGHTRIMLAEILPNALPPIIVTASVMVASAILMESAISFLGLGDANVVSWGSMIGAGREHLRSAWYLCVIPGFAIMFTTLSLNVIGDALNEGLNPRRAARQA
jgi:peptide/nickel transport system permease protein